MQQGRFLHSKTWQTSLCTAWQYTVDQAGAGKLAVYYMAQQQSAGILVVSSMADRRGRQQGLLLAEDLLTNRYTCQLGLHSSRRS